MGGTRAAVEGALHHPQGVQPWGNYLFAQGRDTRNEGLGRLRVLDDELLVQVLGLLPAEALARLACVTRALYCFANHEDLWRGLTLENEALEACWRFKNTWQQTYLRATNKLSKLRKRRPLQVQGFYSDLLYQPWHCSTVPLQRSWLKRDTIDRRADLSLEDFKSQYEVPNKPVILQNAMDGWAALRRWTPAYLKNAFKGQSILAGDYPMSFDNFLAYSQQCCDEMPLYLFDKHFASKAPQLAADYKVPKFFDEDLFSVLGEEGRPDYRWLIMGPPRSGSTFHKDPNATSAWNAVVTGSKKWILYPPHVLPPGVHASDDGADVACPVSLIEWFLNFYKETQNGPVQPLEGICRAGEVLFVPRGWWHMAMNLEESIAVTQNYVSCANLQQVLDFLKGGRAELVSGCPFEQRGGLHDAFVTALQQHRPQVLKELQTKQEQKKAIQPSAQLSALFGARKGSQQPAAFSFQFS
ncbi:hypothetical protein ABBQ32_001885 [Trebouxia sp. C0010 RCD-2024]